MESRFLLARKAAENSEEIERVFHEGKDRRFLWFFDLEMYDGAIVAVC